MERKDFLRQGGPCFYFDTELFAPTTDSFALGWFAAPKRGERVCDLGSGTGLLGTLLLAREPSLTLFCVEQNATANALAEKGFAENGWAERVTLRTGDLRESSALPAAGSMDYVVSNPPYFPAGSGASAAGEARQAAREEVGCTLADVCAAAARVLRWGGRFALVHRPERLSDLSARSARTGWSRSGCASWPLRRKKRPLWRLWRRAAAGRPVYRLNRCYSSAQPIGMRSTSGHEKLHARAPSHEKAQGRCVKLCASFPAAPQGRGKGTYLFLLCFCRAKRTLKRASFLLVIPSC
ncbi:MAG: methyltransferase [Clostridia bacterium]